jgi:hypothetical protein
MNYRTATMVAAANDAKVIRDDSAWQYHFETKDGRELFSMDSERLRDMTSLALAQRIAEAKGAK